MTAKELKDQVTLAITRLEYTVNSGKPSGKEREHVKNLLFNHAHAIVEALDGSASSEEVEALNQKIQDLTEENEALGAALDEMDRKNKELREQLKGSDGASEGS